VHVLSNLTIIALIFIAIHDLLTCLFLVRLLYVAGKLKIVILSLIND
jgi:hypothetical protein